MRKRAVVSAVAVLGTVLLASGCATKSQLRQGLESQTAALQAQKAALEAELEAERAARMAADEQLAADLGALNTDLAGLRTDYGVRIAQLEGGLEFAVPVHFGFDASEVDEGVRPALDRFAQLVQRHYPGSLITVEGFADPAGPAAYNRRLSHERAEAVREYLLTQGLAESQLRAIGYGEDRPVVPGAAGSAYGAELNRRVVFVVETSDPAGAGGPARPPSM